MFQSKRYHALKFRTLRILDDLRHTKIIQVLVPKQKRRTNPTFERTTLHHTKGTRT